MEDNRTGRPPRLLDCVRAALRVRHMGVRTEQAYVGWIRRYIHFQNVRHPDEMGAVEVVEFLSRLAVERNVSASTQNQAAWTRIKVLQRIWPQHAPNLV